MTSSLATGTEAPKEHKLYPTYHSLPQCQVFRDIKFVMENPEHAVIIKKVLDVDPELKPSLITREIEAHPDGTLLM